MEIEKLQLNDVTLCCIDCININRARVALEHSMKFIDYSKILLLSNIKTQLNNSKIKLIQINQITSKESYSRFMIKKLNQFIETKFCLIIQWDGFVVNPDAWLNTFLDYDYIGAPWVQNSRLVGNGGFSLRSKKLLEVCEKAEFDNYHPEDDLICNTQRTYFQNQGIHFAPMSIAYKFSVENEPYHGSFGWHGGTEPQGFKNFIESLKL